MKRRKALQNLAAVTATLMYVPSCTVEEPIPTFSNIPLTKEEYRLMGAIIEAILPKERASVAESNLPSPEISTPEKTEDFVLTMVNDCYKPIEVRRYRRGMRMFLQAVQDEHARRFEQLNKYQHVLMFTEMTESELFPKSLKFFLNTTKRLAVQHFTSSEYFLTQKLEWEFIPGRYVGCVKA